MRTLLYVLITSILWSNSAPAQTIIERGPHHNIFQTIESEEVDGQTLFRTNQFTQLGSGLNYWDAQQNAWVPSSNEIELLPSGAVFQKGQFKLIFASNINDQNGNLEWFPTPDTRVVMQTIGIAMTEVASGNSVFIAQLKDTQGFLTGPNEITYPACFDHLDADVRISVNPFGGGFQNDVILHQRVPDPATFGFQGECRIEAWHQIISGPAPDLQPGAIQRSAVVADPDAQLRFGPMLIGPGTAFLVGTKRAELKSAAGNPVRVAKEYFVDPTTQMRFLIETVPLDEVAPELQQLPPAEGAFKLSPGQRERFQASRRDGKKRHKPIALTAGPRRSERKIVSIIPKARIDKPGFLLDYASLVDQSNYTLRGDTTYLVAANTTVNLSGATVLEPGCVIKFDTYNSANGTPVININGTLDCQTRPYAPAVFTARDDRNVGETNTASNASVQATPYGAYHLKFPASNANAIQLHDIRSRFAQNAFGFLGSGAVEAWNIQVYNSQGDVFEGAGHTVTLRNVLVNNANNVAVATANNTTFQGEHFTIHKASKSFYSASFTGCSCSLINSLVVMVTGTSSSGFATSFSHTLSDDTGVFQTAGSGAHYLASNSPYRNTGSATISTNLAAGVFPYSTTYPPIVLAGNFTGNTTLGPQAQRDTDLPDEGYHYPALDWAVGNISVASGVTLTLTNGVAIAGYDVNALTLSGSANLFGEGRPLTLNRFVRYNAVQEQPTDWGATGATMRLINISAGTQASIRLTEISHLAYSPGSTRNTFLGHSGSTIPTPLLVRDCEIYSSTLGIGPSTGMQTYSVSVLNNLFHRATCSFFSGSGITVNLTFNNNLCRNGSVNFSRQGAGTWTANNNLFEFANPAVSYNSVANSNNGYNSSAVVMSGGLNTKTIATFDYQTGVQGRWYYPTAGANLATLIDGGSGTSAIAGLYHYTVRTDHTKDSGTVDIGYHYVATDSNGGIDTDGDGIPDYLEDRNGNGTADTGELSWTSGLNGSSGLIVYTPLQP